MRGKAYEKHQLSGQSRLGVLIVILFSVCLGYVGWQVLPMYMDYQELLGQMQAQAEKAGLKTDQKIRDFVWVQIKGTGVPIYSKDEIKINRFDGEIVIELKYEEALYVDFGEDRVYDLWVFKFNPIAKARF